VFFLFTCFSHYFASQFCFKWKKKHLNPFFRLIFLFRLIFSLNFPLFYLRFYFRFLVFCIRLFRFRAKRNFRFNFKFCYQSESEGAPTWKRSRYVPHPLIIYSTQSRSFIKWSVLIKCRRTIELLALYEKVDSLWKCWRSMKKSAHYKNVSTLWKDRRYMKVGTLHNET